MHPFQVKCGIIVRLEGLCVTKPESFFDVAGNASEASSFWWRDAMSLLSLRE